MPGPLISLMIGIAYWLIVSLATGRAEPWDAGAYWIFAYPLALVMAAGIGFARPRKAWFSGALLILAQLPVMLMTTGEVGSMIVFGLALLIILSLPAAGLAALMARLGKRPAKG